MTTASGNTDYYTLPLELFTLADLLDAVGVLHAAEILKTTPAGLRNARSRGRMSLERMEALQDHIRTDEDRFRRTLVTLRAHGLSRSYKRPT